MAPPPPPNASNPTPALDSNWIMLNYTLKAPNSIVVVRTNPKHAEVHTWMLLESAQGWINNIRLLVRTGPGSAQRLRPNRGAVRCHQSTCHSITHANCISHWQSCAVMSIAATIVYHLSNQHGCQPFITH
jgi:hypothetical protein